MGHPPHVQTNQSSGHVILQCGRCHSPLETSKTLYNVLGSCGTKHTIPSTCSDRKHTFSNTYRSVKYCLPTNNWEHLYTDKTLGALFALPHSWLLNNSDLEATIFKYVFLHSHCNQRSGKSGWLSTEKHTCCPVWYTYSWFSEAYLWHNSSYQH